MLRSDSSTKLPSTCKAVIHPSIICSHFYYLTSTHHHPSIKSPFIYTTASLLPFLISYIYPTSIFYLPWSHPFIYTHDLCVLPPTHHPFIYYASTIYLFFHPSLPIHESFIHKTTPYLSPTIYLLTIHLQFPTYLSINPSTMYLNTHTCIIIFPSTNCPSI